MSGRLSTALSSAALVVAVLGWTPLGEAARDVVFPANSVGTTQLKANAVVSAKIRNGSVAALDIQKRSITAAHVRPGSLLAANFKAGQLPAGPKGDKGDKGEKGDAGERGLRGEPGLSAYQVVVSAPLTVAPNTRGLRRVACAAGKRPIGGGGHFAGSLSSAGYLSSSIPIDQTQWQAGYRNAGPDNISIWAYAVCATVTP